MKKLTTKQIITIIVVGLIILSVGLNIYNEYIKLRGAVYAEGFQAGINSAVQQIKSGVKVEFSDGVIQFVPNQII